MAVHVIPDDDPRAEALLAAARASANVTDGHLLRVLDAASEDGMTYVVNEWGSGISLDRLLAEGPLSPRRAAWVAKEVAEAITAAHRQGIAHGRLLPENVMVTEAGSVKLIGFVVDAVLRGDPSTRVTDGARLEQREADVVNLAALLYAGLVGRWPGTQGTTLSDAPTEHSRALRPRQVRAGVPRPLDAICERVLNPDAHHQVTPIGTAHEIYAALSDYIGDPTGAAAAGPLPEAESTGSHAAVTPDGPEPGAVGDVAADTGGAHRGAGAPDDTAPDGIDATAVSGDSGESGVEATQAGTPVFYDEDTGVGWVPSTPRGLRRDDPGSPGSEEATRVAPPPPPVLPEPEPRPLFASEEPRPVRPEPTDHRPRSTGAGNGSIPAAWGPDADTPPPVEETGDWATGSHAAWEEERPGRSWMRLAGALAGLLLLGVAIVFAFDLGRDAGPDEEAAPSPTPSTSAAPRPVDIQAVSDFDPQGDPPEENSDSAALAIDGDPSTAWPTSTYQRTPELGNLKDGVGLLVDLGKTQQVRGVDLTFIGSPTSVQILAAGENAPAPDSADGLNQVAGKDGAGTQAELELDQPATTRYLVVWLTSVPPVSDGFKGQVAEIVVRS